MALDLASLANAQIKVSEFISHEKTWDISKVSQVLPISLVRVVSAVSIPLENIPDSFCWGLMGSGELSTKSATWMAHSCLPDQTP